MPTHQTLVVPGDTLLLVGIGVGVALDLTGLTAEETPQVGADLVGTALLESVALRATGLEETSALGGIAWFESEISKPFLFDFSFPPLFELNGRDDKGEFGDTHGVKNAQLLLVRGCDAE